MHRCPSMLSSCDTATSSRLLIPRYRQTQSIQLYHHHLWFGMTLDPVDYIAELGHQLVRTFTGWPQLKWLSCEPGWMVQPEFSLLPRSSRVE
jgi:hypothetical protein